MRGKNQAVIIIWEMIMIWATIMIVA